MPCVPQTSAEFLEAFGQYHVLCAIHPSGGALVCTAGTIDEVLTWAQGMNDKGWNVYFHVNTVRRGLVGRAKREDIAQLNAAFDDLDWGWKANPGRYQERIGELTEQQQAFYQSSTPPSISVFTGGGYQNYYILTQPIPNTPDNSARIEAISRAMADQRGGDQVGNIDRILRLPGFVNYPNPRKAAAGQPAKRAEVVSWR